MGCNRTYTSDQELKELYNSLDKEALVKLLIEKFRQTELKSDLLNPVIETLPNDLAFAKWISKKASSTKECDIWLDLKLYEKTTEELYEIFKNDFR